MPGRMDGEVALVTGATAGIGRAIATRFGAEGARVVVTGRDEERGDAVVAEIAARGDRAAFVAADLADEGACEALVRGAAEAFGRLTVLVNNAVTSSGPGRDAAAADVDTAAWEHVLRVNLTAALWTCRYAIPHMVAAGHGSIVNVSSRAAQRGTPGLAAYAVSKGGLEALTRSIAVDYARVGVRCNAISPGYVLNDRRDADLDPERRRDLEAMHLTRLGTADDVALAAVYLASAESEIVTGTVLPLDGGSTAARGRVLG